MVKHDIVLQMADKLDIIIDWFKRVDKRFDNVDNHFKDLNSSVADVEKAQIAHLTEFKIYKRIVNVLALSYFVPISLFLTFKGIDLIINIVSK